MPRIETAPFVGSEFTLLAKYLEGESTAFEALRLQLDSLRYESVTFRAPYMFGIRWRRLAVTRPARRLRFRVGWGYGSEDYLLGERRPLVLRDVVALLEDGRYLFSELRIDAGRLRELCLLGAAKELGTALEPPPVSLNGLRLASVAFCEPWDPRSTASPARIVAKRTIDGPHPCLDSNLSESLSIFQRWLVSLNDVQVAVPPPHLPLRWRQARPASFEEMRAFEKKLQVVMPTELKEMWSVTNGASFFGDIIRGTYDAGVFGKVGNRHLVILESVREPGICFAIKLQGDATHDACVAEEDIGARQTKRRWASLHSCLRELTDQLTAVRNGE